MDNETLATELLREVKASARRWFIAFCIMVGLEIFTVLGFVWYMSLPTEDTITTQTVDSIEGSDVQQIAGDYNGESDTDNTQDKEGSTK